MLKINHARPDHLVTEMCDFVLRGEVRNKVAYRTDIMSIRQAGTLHLTDISSKTVSGITDFLLCPEQRAVLEISGQGRRCVSVEAVERDHVTLRFEGDAPHAPPPLLTSLADGARPPEMTARLSIIAGPDGYRLQHFAHRGARSACYHLSMRTLSVMPPANSALSLFRPVLP